MSKHQKVADLVKVAYQQSAEDFAQWAWVNHVPVVAQRTLELAQRFGANEEIAVAGAWLHDFGDVLVNRYAPEHGEISTTKATKILQAAGYTNAEIKKVLEEVMLPHSCKDGLLPTTLEGKVMATADALAHLMTDFYVQFAWKKLPEGKEYGEFLVWFEEKVDRDFHSKIFFDQVREEVRYRYEALREVFLSR